MIKMKKINKFSLLLFGILAPMPIIRLLSITTYVWFILLLGLISIIEFVRNRKIGISKHYDKLFIAVLFTWLISYLFCALRMPKEWTSDLLTSFLQLCSLIVVYIFFTQKNKVHYLIYYIKGVYISSIIQMFWGYLQIVFNIMGRDLNKIVFTNILHMFEGEATQYQFGQLKVSGMCWNAGNFAPLITFGYIYTKNRYLKVFFLLLGVLSGSRTLMLGLFMCVFIEFVISKPISKRIKTFVSKKKAFFLIITLISLFLVLATNFERIMKKIIYIIDLLDLKNRVKTEGSANTHLYYLTSIPTITIKNDFLSNLFGYGPGCSGYPQSILMDFYTDMGKWSIECDYVNILWSYGYIGFFVYYYWYFKNILSSISLEKKYTILFGAFLFEGLMYNITFNWVLFLIISIFVLTQSKICIFIQ